VNTMPRKIVGVLPPIFDSCPRKRVSFCDKIQVGGTYGRSSAIRRRRHAYDRRLNRRDDGRGAIEVDAHTPLSKKTIRKRR